MPIYILIYKLPGARADHGARRPLQQHQQPGRELPLPQSRQNAPADPPIKRQQNRRSSI